MKGNKRIAQVEIENLLPAAGEFITDINPSIKLELLSHLSTLHPTEICNKYKISFTSLQQWSNLLTFCNDDSILHIYSL